MNQAIAQERLRQPVRPWALADAADFVDSQCAKLRRKVPGTKPGMTARALRAAGGLRREPRKLG